MTTTVAEIAKISQTLPAGKAAQVLDFARSLLATPAAEGKLKLRKSATGDAAWERIISSPQRRPKLEAVRKRLDRLKREGKLELFDFKKL